MGLFGKDKAFTPFQSKRKVAAKAPSRKKEILRIWHTKDSRRIVLFESLVHKLALPVKQDFDVYFDVDDKYGYLLAIFKQRIDGFEPFVMHYTDGAKSPSVFKSDLVEWIISSLGIPKICNPVDFKLETTYMHETLKGVKVYAFKPCNCDE